MFPASKAAGNIYRFNEEMQFSTEAIKIALQFLRLVEAALENNYFGGIVNVKGVDYRRGRCRERMCTQMLSKFRCI